MKIDDKLNNYEFRQYIIDKVDAELGHISIPAPIKYGDNKVTINAIRSNGVIDYLYHSIGISDISNIHGDIIKEIYNRIKKGEYI